VECSSLVLATMAPFTGRRASRTPRNFFVPLQGGKFMYNPTLLIELITPIASPPGIRAVLEKVWGDWLLKHASRTRSPNPLQQAPLLFLTGTSCFVLRSMDGPPLSLLP